MKQKYEIEKNIEKIRKGKYTDFISPNIYKEITYKLKRNEYSIYYPYPDSEKIILYTNKIPTIKLFKIKSYHPLTHSMIMGSLFGLNINNEVIGDIIIDNNNYYFYTIDKIGNFIKDTLFQIGPYPVKIEEINLSTLKDYQRKYEEKETITTSLRIDNVISKIISTNREKVKDKIKNKEILLNHDILTNNSYILKENDIFSIRKHGKYKFIGIIKTTKKDNYIIKYLKYI